MNTKLKWALQAVCLAAVAIAAGLLFGPVAEGQGPQNVSVALVIDNSGSMGSTDPAGLRFATASQLVDLLETGDEITVILFSDASTVVVPLTGVTNEASKEAIKASLTPIAPAGNTNMRAGLQSALEELAKGSQSTRITIFLTDGELHPPGWEDFSPEEQEAERAAVQGLAETFGGQEWSLFPISLASAIDPEFLQQMAEKGGGIYQQALQAAELTLVFQEVFAASKLDVFEVLFVDCAAPGEQTTVTFPVHEFVSSLSLFVTYTSDLRPTVEVAGPDDKVVGPTGGDIRYDSFSLEDPARGVWTVTITGATQGESCVAISSTPRTLVEVTLIKPPPSVSPPSGEPLEIVVRLAALDPASQDEFPLEDATVTASVTGPQGQVHESTLDHIGSGEYAGTAETDLVEGSYTIEIVAVTNDGVVARSRFETFLSLAVPDGSPATTPVPEPKEDADGDDAQPPLLLILLGSGLAVGLTMSFAAYSHFGRPLLSGWLVYPQGGRGRAYNLDGRHRRVWSRRAMTIGGRKEDIDLELSGRVARLVPRRGGECFLRALSKDEVAVNGRMLKKGERQRLRHNSEITIAGITLVYRFGRG